MKYLWRIVLALLMSCAVASGAYANDEWRGEFDRLCGYTQEADKYSIAELQGFMAECDKLKEVMTNSASSTKKVYLFRLKKCRNFFEYMISVKEVENEKGK